MCSVATAERRSHAYTRWAMKSGPLSLRMWVGTPRLRNSLTKHLLAPPLSHRFFR
jgi:hypothetical protein